MGLVPPPGSTPGIRPWFSIRLHNTTQEGGFSFYPEHEFIDLILNTHVEEHHGGQVNFQATHCYDVKFTLKPGNMWQHEKHRLPAFPRREIRGEEASFNTETLDHYCCMMSVIVRFKTTDDVIRGILYTNTSTPPRSMPDSTRQTLKQPTTPWTTFCKIKSSQLFV